MSQTLAVPSIIVAAAFFAVLCALLNMLARRLRSIAGSLSEVSSDVEEIYRHCAAINPSVENMNLNLYEVAAQLLEVGDVAEERAP
jgi:septal ring factor EnvC (AmiA/AmiB activator)